MPDTQELKKPLATPSKMLPQSGPSQQSKDGQNRPKDVKDSKDGKEQKNAENEFIRDLKNQLKCVLINSPLRFLLYGTYN